MAVNPTPGAGNLNMVRGVHDARSLKTVSKQVAEESADVVNYALDDSVKTQMTQDVGLLRQELTSQGATLGQMRAALMIAGAMISGPNGVFPDSMAETLHQAVSNRETRAELAQDALAISQPGGMQEARLESMGHEVTRALVDNKVQGNDVPTALFMGGAIRNHQARKEGRPMEDLRSEAHDQFANHEGFLFERPPQ